MADSIRQRLISAIDTRLKTILIASGYKTNMGQNIFEWKTDPFQASQIDGLTYRDPKEQRELGCGIYDLTLPLEIEIASTTPAQVRKCLADLEKAVHVDPTWGGLAFGRHLCVRRNPSPFANQKRSSFGSAFFLWRTPGPPDKPKRFC